MADNKTKREPYKSVVASGMAGNLMEWYDFAVYGYMVPVISKQFFPHEDPLTAMIAAFSAFAAGYFARPLGAIILGHIGDRYGRKPMLVLSVTLMGVATSAVGLIPSYSQIGISATVLLVLFRVLHGIAAGGKYAGAITFVLEYAPDEKQGFATSWINAGGVLGLLIGTGVGALMVEVFTPEQINSGAWRLPFFAGILIVVDGYLIHRHATEPPRPRSMAMETAPVLTALHYHWQPMLQLLGLALCVNVGFYMMFIYAISYLTEHMHYSVLRAMEIDSINLFILAMLIPVVGFVCDKLGRKPVLLSGILAMTFLSYPLFWMVHHVTDGMVFFGQLGFTLILALLYGSSAAVQGELLPRSIRASGLAIAYSICLVVFGGTTPLAAEYLLLRTADDFSPAWYLMGLSVVSLIAVLTIPETCPRLRTDSALEKGMSSVSKKSH